MSTHRHPSSLAVVRSTLAALGCAVGLAFLSASALKAADAPAAPAAKAAKLPVAVTFEKNPSAEKGQYILVVKNEGKSALDLRAQIALSVAFHGTNRNKDVAPHTLGPGESWKISDLAAGDAVTLNANGYESLTVTVP